MKMNQSNNFLRLIGTWATKGKVLSPEKKSGIELKGIDSYELVLDGHYILHKANVVIGSKRSETIELISTRGEEITSQMQYFNSEGENGMMTGMISNNDFQIDGEILKFRGQLNENDTVITGTWFVKSADGDWRQFIEMKLEWVK